MCGATVCLCNRVICTEVCAFSAVVERGRGSGFLVTCWQLMHVDLVLPLVIVLVAISEVNLLSLLSSFSFPFFVLLFSVTI